MLTAARRAVQGVCIGTPRWRQGARRHGRALAADRPLLNEYVGALASSTKALERLVRRSVNGRRWLVPDAVLSPPAPVWTSLKPGGVMPYSVLAVRAAAAHADTLRDTAESWFLPTAPTMLHAALRLASPAAVEPGLAPHRAVPETGTRRPLVPGRPVVSPMARAR